MFTDCFDSAVRFDGSPQDLQQRSSEIPSGRGVLLFCDVDDRPIQLLVAADLRRTARSRLSIPQGEQPTRRARLSEVARTAYFRPAGCEFQAHWDLLRIARHLFSDSYRDMILLPSLHLIQIDRAVPWPRFSFTSRPDFQSPTDSPGRRVFGPFPRRKACIHLMDIQTRAFDLCRNPNLLDSPDRARNCPYLQMGSCCAPCIGKLQPDEYGRRLDAAVDLAAGRFDRVLTLLEERMRIDARSLRFEAADRLKQVIADIQKSKSGDARWTADVSELSILHIDRSTKVTGPGKKRIQTYAAFHFHCGSIIRLPDFTLDQIPSVLESVKSLRFSYRQVADNAAADSLARLENPFTPGLLSDQFALIAFFLFRSSPPGLWLQSHTSLPDQGQITESLSAL